MTVNVMSTKKSPFNTHHCFKQMRTTPTPRLSFWPSLSTTTPETTPSSKWRCSGRQSFLKLSKNTRKTHLPTSPLHTWQRYILIFNRLIFDYYLFKWMSFLVCSVQQRSLEDEINRTTAEDIPIFMISYAVIFVYIAVALGEYTSWKRILVRND